MFFGSTRMEYLSGKESFREIGYLKTTNVPLSQASANLGVLQLGKMMNEAADPNEETEMVLGDGFALGFMTRALDLYGTTGDTSYKKLGIGNIDIPVKRGAPVTLQCPFPGAQAIFEGTGSAATPGDTLVCDAGTGALSSGTAKLSELSVIKGAWRLAQTGEMVLGLLLDNNLTPKNVGELRIRLMFVSPYKKA